MRSLLLSACLFAAANACAQSTTLDADALIGRLGRAAPSTTPFVEARFSPLLREPIVVSGELGYLGPTSLDRNVTAPYREHTAIRGEAVSIERDGEAARTFALRRAPELRGLLTGFAGVLAGDRAAVRKDFGVASRGSDDAWTLELTPLEAAMQRRLLRIVVTGAQSEPRCVFVFNAREGATAMLLGAAAALDVRPDVTIERLLDYCHAA